MINNVTVVIRSSGERTEEYCASIIRQQVPEENVVIIRERPFSKAVRRNFELGIEKGLKWTLAVDADILLKTGAIKELIETAESLQDHFFLIQGAVLDKFFCAKRGGGPHLYRTSFLEEALVYIPDEGSSLRPESHTYQLMAQHGKHTFQGSQVYGIHDYEQYHEDIFRKAFLHAKKHEYLVNHFESLWSKFDEQDYRVALEGLQKGKEYQGNVRVDKSFYKDEIVEAIKELGIEQKSELQVDEISSVNLADNTLKAHSSSKETELLEKSKYVKEFRTDQIEKPHIPFMKKVAWKISKFMGS